MGFFDRLKGVAEGVGGAIQAPFGLAYDIVRSPFVDDDVDGIIGTLTATTASRTGQFFGNLFGPEEGLGAVIGGLPDPVRAPLRPVLPALETGFREGVAEPISTALTAGSLAASKQFLEQEGRGTGTVDQLTALFDPDTWQRADEIAEHRSPGQSLALMFQTKDILDQEEVERAVGTDLYQLVSGTTDALARIFLSPDIIAFKGGSVVRAARLTPGRGAPIGRLTAQAPLQLGRRAERFGGLAGGQRGQRAIDAINRNIDRAYVRLPQPLKGLVGSERTFNPADIERLTRLETERRLAGRARLTTEGLEREARRSSDPTRIRVLSNVAESRRARGAAGRPVEQIPRLEAERDIARQFARQSEADIDAYFAAANRPQRKGFFSNVTRTPGWRRVDEVIDKFDPDVDARAGLIRDRLFPSHPRGDIIARYLAEAQGPAERESIMRVFLGDMRAIRRLDESDHALAMRLQDLAFDQFAIRAEPILTPIADAPGGQLSFLADPDGNSPFFDDLRNTKDRLSRIGEEMDAVVDEAARNRRLRQGFRALPGGPTYTRRQGLRNAVKGSSFYQTSRAGKAVRLVTDMRPHHIVDAGVEGADAQLARMMREANFSDQEIGRARGEFVRLSPESRGVELENWVERTERRVLKEHGLDESEIAEVIAHGRFGKNQARGIIRGSQFDAEGRARVRFHDGDEMVEVELPLSVTQLQNTVTIPNFHNLRKAAASYARLKYGDDFRAAIARGGRPANTLKDLGVDAMRGIMDVWKPAVLLRPAWTLRVVGDEQMRQIAKFGALTVALEARQNLNNYMAQLKTNPILRRVLRTDAVPKAKFRGSVAGAATGGALAGPIGAVAGGAIGNRLVRKMAMAEERGFTNIRFGGHSISGPFGDAGSTAEVYRTLNSARQTVDELFGTHEARFFGTLRRDPTSYRTRVWGESDQADAVYRSEWVRNLRRQIAQDRMGRQFLAGKNVDEVLDWLNNTLEGRSYAALVPWRTDRRAWAEAYADQIQSYTGGLDDVKQGILTLPDDASDAQAAKLLDLIPEDQRAPIHGAETELLQARNPVNQALNSLVQNGFDILGTMATDTLSRNPTFARFYQAEARRLFAGLEPGRVPEDLLRSLESQARDFALRETRELLYDLAERSRFADMTRLLMPFFPAWQEVLTRWAGLAVENPVFAARAKEVWQAPNRVGWTFTNDQGDTFVRIRIPEFARGLLNQGVFRGALNSQGEVFLDKNGFNLVAQGTPGFGPFAQIAVSQAVERVPELEESVQFIIPFGPTDAIDALLPSIANRFRATTDEESRARANAEARILTTKLTQMQTGEIPQVDFSDPAARQAFLDEVDSEAEQLMKFRIFAGFVSPVSPLFESPYKPYIEVYRALRDGDWERARQLGEQFELPGAEQIPATAPVDARGGREITADDIFLDVFGEEFFALTQSLTETVNGVPPTLEGLQAQEQFGDIISAFPEWGGVIAGYDGGGEAVKFSRAVYDRQLATGERRRIPIDELADQPDIRLGWATYSQAMDQIENLRIARGLPNLQVKEAEDLRLLKQAVVLDVATRHPAWYQEFSVTDRSAWTNRIEGARAMVANPVLARRPDIRGLADYLSFRDQVMQLLEQREAAGESGTLQARANFDLAQLWDTGIGILLDQNPAFADLFYRKLENDPVIASPLVQLQQNLSVADELPVTAPPLAS